MWEKNFRTFGPQELEIWHFEGFLYCRILTKPLPEKSGAPVWCHRGGRGSETGRSYHQVVSEISIFHCQVARFHVLISPHHLVVTPASFAAPSAPVTPNGRP